MPYWLRLYLPLAALLAALLAGYGWLEDRRELQALESEQGARLLRAEHVVNGRFDDMVADLRFLAGADSLQELVRAPTPEGIGQAASLFAGLMRQKPQYQQLRLLDDGGREIVRVDAAAGGPRRMPEAQLQDKSGRDYFESARLLQSGSVYVSRLDLNVEHGQIEVPHTPVLRMSMPLRAPGQPALVLVLSLRGDSVLQALRDTLDSEVSEVSEGMLIDVDGYWLYHVNPEWRWGAQLEHGMSMPRRYPQAWDEMRRGLHGNVATADDGLFVFRRIYPFRRVPGLRGDIVEAGWWLVLRIPPEALAQMHHPLLSPLFWALQLLALLGSLAAARLRAEARRAHAQERATRELAERQDRERARTREHIYQLTLSLQGASSPEVFGRTVLSELAPLLGLVVGALYGLEDGWLRPLAGFGMPEDHLLRQFRFGESLVGESLRDRREIVLEQLPPGYLEVRSALGRSAPARLLIVPLWVREESLGVLELGVAAPLEPWQSQLLRQMIPLLALHLGNYLKRAKAA